MNRNIMWSVIWVALLGSCSEVGIPPVSEPDGPGADVPQPSVPASFGIQDAETLFVSVSGVSRSIADGTTVLYKVTDDGEVLEVPVMGESGEEIAEDLTPTGVYELNSDYIIVECNSIPGLDVPAVLVRISDGAVFSLDEVGLPLQETVGYGVGETPPFMGLTRPKSDAAGIVYFLAEIEESGVRVVALDVGNPEALNVTRITPVTDNVYGFAVAPEGHVAYVYGDGGSNRIRKVGGGIYNLPDAVWLTLWTGMDGKFHYQDTANTGGHDLNRFYSVTIDENEDVSMDYVVGTGLTDMRFDSLLSYLLRMGDRTYLIEANPPHKSYIAEVENPAGIPRRVSLEEISSIDFAGASADHYFLAGADESNNPVLVKVDPLTDTVTPLLPSGGIEYDILAMWVAPDATVTFNALRFTDGARVIGRVGSDGSVSILDETMEADVISLVQLN